MAKNVDSMVIDERSEEKPVDREKVRGEGCKVPVVLWLNCYGDNCYACCATSNLNIFMIQDLTRMDCSLRELTSLIKEVNPDARRRGTYYEFAIVYADTRTPNYRLRDIGVTCSGQRGVDDTKTIGQAKFEIGDYVDVAITVPGPRPLMRRGGGRSGGY